MMNRKPVIGITPYRKSETGERYMPEGYTRGLQETGCELRIIDYMTIAKEELPELVKGLDGMLFSGGPDVDPKFYDMEMWPECGTPTLERDEIELELFRLVYPTGMPIFGICRGVQLINVAMGGTLVQHVPKLYGNVHQQDSDQPPFSHKICLIPETRVSRIFGDLTFPVDSYHHQSVARLGEGLVISAYSEDGVTEAVELPGDRFLVGLQWHPEKTLGLDEYSFKPFCAFREAVDRFMAEEGRI